MHAKVDQGTINGTFTIYLEDGNRGREEYSLKKGSGKIKNYMELKFKLKIKKPINLFEKHYFSPLKQGNSRIFKMMILTLMQILILNK